MFRPRRLLLGFRPANGQHVLVRARVSLYEGRGEFQLIVEHMEPAGEGALRLELERLKQRLAAEGLFEARHKRPLPPFPRCVGLITSPTGAAIRDLLAVLRRRFPALPVILYPAQVQGDGAVEELVAALQIANSRAECDVLILARGGGSLEDLMAFNAEALARAIRASAIPVVTGVGHEIDTSIADLAADQRGATPSAAAELVSPSAEHVAERLRAFERRLATSEGRILAGLRQRLGAANRHLALVHPLGRVQRRQQQVDELARRLAEALGRRLERERTRWAALDRRLTAASPARGVERLRVRSRAAAERLRRILPSEIASRRSRLAVAVQGLEALSPLATLARGYALVRLLPDRQVLRDARDAAAGAEIEAQLARGRIKARVEGAVED
jgi:exodeoxyribonuclease VII large subunit